MTIELEPEVCSALGEADEEVSLIALRAITADESKSPVAHFEAHAALAQEIRFSAHLTDMEKLDTVIDHLRAAFKLVDQYVQKDTSGGSGAIVASMLGEALTRRSEHAALDELSSLWEDAETALQFAVDHSQPTEPRLVVRLSNLAKNLMMQATGTATDAKADEAVALFRQSLDLADRLDVDDSTKATILTNLGHATRTSLLASPTRSAAELDLGLAEVEGLYDQASSIAMRAGLVDPVALGDRAVLAWNRHGVLGDDAALENAVQLGREAHASIAPDHPRRPQLEMQLAGYLRARFALHGDEQDLRDCADLSESAVESPYLGRHGVTHHELKWGRIEQLKTVAATFGDWGAERRDMRRLLDEAIEAEGLEPTPEIEFLRREQELEGWRTAMTPRSDPVEGMQLAEALSESATTAGFTSSRATHVARYVELEMRLVASLEFHSIGPPDFERLEQAAIELKTSATNADEEPKVRVYAMLVLTQLQARLAFEDEAWRSKAADTAFATLQLAAAHQASVPIVNLVEAANMAQRLCHYQSRVGDRRTALDLLRSYVNQLPTQKVPTDALLASTRRRKSFAAEIAANTPNVRDGVWTQIALSAHADLVDLGTRSEVLLEIADRSQSTPQLFLAMGRTNARAITVIDNSWEVAELPALSFDMIGPAIAAAFRAHQLAEQGDVNDKAGWLQSRIRLHDQLLEALAPVTTALGGCEAAEIHLGGYAHLVPVIPTLARATKYECALAAVFTSIASTGHQQPTKRQQLRLVAVAAPGSNSTYLPTAIDDVEHITSMPAFDPSRQLIDPTPNDAVAALASSETALFAAHGVGSHGNPGESSLILRDEKRLSVRDLLDLNLHDVALVVFSACESLSPDAQIYENPLSLGTATLEAGAGAAIGSHWRVDDRAASQFTKELFTQLAAGIDLPTSYVKALETISLLSGSPATTPFTLYARRPFGSIQ